MKTWERLIAYFTLLCAICYGLWAHDRLNLLYEINRQRFLDSASSHPPPITCTQYNFSIVSKTPDLWTIKWSAWVDNPNPYWVHGVYLIEFRNSTNSLLKLEGPVSADFPSTKTPREATALCELPAQIAIQVDFSKSRIFISTED